MTRSSAIVIVVSALFAAYVIYSARKRRTHERHTFAWLSVAASVVALAVWRPAVDAIASAMGIHYAPSALFFGALAAFLWLVYRLSLQVAEQRRQIQRLAQEMAILTARSGRESLEEEASTRAAGQARAES